MKRIVYLLLAMAAGCQAPVLGPYTSPAIHGRVLDGGTRRPLGRVLVRRGAHESDHGLTAPKGGELLMQKAGVRTGPDGCFSFLSESALTIFRPADWNQAQLEFKRSGYLRFQTNYSIPTPATNSPNGEPVLDTGDTLLQKR
jgi:hypothetical protein